MGVLANDISPIPLMSAHARLVLYMSAVLQSMAFHTADDGFALSAPTGLRLLTPYRVRLTRVRVDFVAWMQQREIQDRSSPGFHFIASGLRLLFST